MRRRRKLAHAGPSKTNVTFQVPLDLLDPRAAPQEIGEWMVKKFFLASLCSRSSGRHGGVRGQVDRREEEPDMDMTEHANVDFVPRSP